MDFDARRQKLEQEAAKGHQLIAKHRAEIERLTLQIARIQGALALLVEMEGDAQAAEAPEKEGG